MKNCANPIDAAILADYWMAVLPESEQETVEVHLLGCDECGTRLRKMIALAEGVRKLAREGSLRMIVSDSFLKRAAEEGLRIRQYAPPAGGGVQCTVTEEDDLLIGRLAADLTGAGHVDLCFYNEKGTMLGRFPDIPVRPDTKEVVYQESITFAKGAPDNVMIARLVAVDDSGHERMIGEYAFNHKRSIPGPPTWGN